MNQKAWNEPRLLRGHARARLYSAFNGRCALCGEHLDHGWEADHVIRWCETKRTRADEMQPLCPHCHAQKTKEESINMSKLFGFRGHQRELNQWFEDNIKDGKLLTNKVCLDVTPGGGKSTLPSIMAMHLIPQGIVDIVVWVTPRQNLSKQAAEGFEVDRNRFANKVRGERFYCPYKGVYRRNTAPILSNKEVYKEGVRCYTTTYSAIIAADKTPIHHDMFRDYKVALVLDECHHLADTEKGQKSGEAIKPLMDKAVFTMVMTGTPDRRDGEQILGMQYAEDRDAKTGAYLPKPNITYSRGDAIGEGAKLPIKFRILDGTFRFTEDTSDVVYDEEIESVRDEGLDNPDGILLSTADDQQRSKIFRHGMKQDSLYVKQALDDTVADFKAHRKLTGYEHSQLIVVVSLQDDAEYWQRYLFHDAGLKTALAISSNNESCAQIESFRNGIYDALITVGMAYEGLDAPRVTHMCVLRNIRSEPWIEQCFDRATRIDFGSKLPPESQCAHIFVPSDERLQGVIRSIKQVQLKGVETLRRRVKENEVKALNGELDTGVYNPQVPSPAIEKMLAEEDPSWETIQEAKSRVNQGSSLAEYTAVREAEKKFRKEHPEFVPPDRVAKGGYDEDEDQRRRRIQKSWHVESGLVGQRIGCLDFPVLSEDQEDLLARAMEQEPLLQWAPVERVLKLCEQGVLNV